MFCVVTGGSGSGKSAYAERLVETAGNGKRYYIATMQCQDEESAGRIARHRAMRAGKQFETVECPKNLQSLSLAKGGTALLECMSNLVANEYFDGERHTPGQTAERIMDGIEGLLSQCSNLIVVTNEVFSQGQKGKDDMEGYLECLGQVNRRMAERADLAVEVVYGIPVLLKGEEGIL